MNEKNNFWKIWLPLLLAVGAGLYAYGNLNGRFDSSCETAEKEREEIKAVNVMQQAQISTVQEQAVRTEERLKALDGNMEKLDKSVREGFKSIEKKLENNVPGR